MTAMMMGDPIRIVQPSALPVTLAELKAQCRYYESDEDAILMAYLRSAVDYVENYTSMGLITQTWTQTYSSFPVGGTMLRLYRRPLQSVASVAYLGEAGDTQFLGSSVYRVNGIGQPYHSGWVTLASGQVWPDSYVTVDSVTVTYNVGFGDNQNAVPEIIRHAVLLAASTWFAFREEVTTGISIAELPFNVKTLLSDYRPLAVA
jgi:uncharacterized phiE125 gp8 family phage protein